MAAALTLAVLLAVALAGCGRTAGFRVENALFDPPVGAGDVGVAYFSIQSFKADKIVKVSSPFARAVEMHAMEIKGTMMSMPRTDSVDLPAGQKVEFKPGGRHLMVFSPAPLASGATFPITIELQSGLKQTVAFPVAKGGGAQRN